MDLEFWVFQKFDVYYIYIYTYFEFCPVAVLIFADLCMA